jgi:hypothetical protein
MGEPGRKLSSVAHPELAIRTSEVSLDCLWAQDELGRGLANRGAAGDDQGDVLFLRGEIVAVWHAASRLSRYDSRAQLSPSPIGPGSRVELLERSKRS